MLKCGKTKYHELVKLGQINSVRVQNQTLIERASVERFIASHNFKYNKNRKSYMTKKDTRWVIVNAEHYLNQQY